MSEENGNGLNQNTSKPTFSPREIIMRYVRYAPWIAISLALFLIAAYLKIRYTTPIYNVTSKLLVKNQSPYSSGGEKFDDIFMMQALSRNLNDEIEIIKSRPMARRVVNKLGLQLQIQNKGSIRTSLIYHRDAPFNVHFVRINDSSASLNLPIIILNDKEYRIADGKTVNYFGEIVDLPFGKIQISRNRFNLQAFASKEFIISWAPIDVRATGLKAGINVARTNDISSVLTLSFQTQNTNMGIDIVNQYMEEFQQSSLEDKRQIAVNTLAFIDEQLDTVRIELGGAERNLQQYREKNKVFAPEQQSTISFTEISESSKQLYEQSVKLKVAEFLYNYIADETNPYRMVPATLGIEEPSLIQQITEYNKLQLERTATLKTTGANNQVIRSMEITIDGLRRDMLENLNNIKKTYELTIRDLERLQNEAKAEIKNIPQKEKQLLEVTRQQNILQELYQYLLQKKLETSISSASTISNIRPVEQATVSGTPVSPNKRTLYLIAILLGLGVPAGIIFLIEYLNDKVKTRADIEKHTNTPILGEIGHAEEGGALVVTKNNRKFIAEQFRIIRSNLQYVLPKTERPVIMVTSSFSGEGKSFISTNMGAVLAISGKKTVILEFDIRKPKILKGLGLNERKGITNFLVGSTTLDAIIHPVPGVDNLYVIPCGPVPPNPAEMLLDSRVDELFQQLRRQFDTIIVDTAPVGLVSDSITLGKHADAVIYIVRHSYTLKKQLTLIEELYSKKKLPHLSLIINDIKITSGYGGYYGYGGYGYGYGYGYGSDYFDNGSAKKRRKWKLKTKN